MFPEDVIKEYPEELKELGYQVDDCYVTNDVLMGIIDSCEALRREKALTKRIEDLEKFALEVKEKLGL
ncbi:MAG: hypothetical protein WCG45_04905 [bacterium]